jgi:hypothetical protein
MLNCQSVDGQIVSLAEAVYAEVRYELDMDVDSMRFFKLDLQRTFMEQQFLNFNLYKSHI